MGLGIAYGLKEAYLQAELPGIFYYLTLQFIPRWGRGLLFIMLSVGTVGISIYKLNQSLLFAFVRPDYREDGQGTGLARRYTTRLLQRGPRVVGSVEALVSRNSSDMKDYTTTTAIARRGYGGSTGRLRQEFGVVARVNFASALGMRANLMSKLLKYRYGRDRTRANPRNLFIVARRSHGNFETAIRGIPRLNVRGASSLRRWKT